MDYEKLSDREIDALVAERLFGLVRAGSWLAHSPRYLDPELPEYNNPAKQYCGDENCTRYVRDRIAEWGLWPQFVYHSAGTCAMAPRDPAADNITRLVWATMQTTPRQQCIAALKAVEKEE